MTVARKGASPNRPISEAVHPSAAAVLAACLRRRHPTVAGVARDARVSKTAAYQWLLWWRKQGMIDWAPGLHGTMVRATTVTMRASNTAGEADPPDSETAARPPEDAPEGTVSAETGERQAGGGTGGL